MKLWVGLLIGVLIISSFYSGFYINDSSIELKEVYEENYLIKTILIADAEYSTIAQIKATAEIHYEEAGLAYENQNYLVVETECKRARESYLEASQGYREIKVMLQATESEEKIIQKYILITDTSIELVNNMFEACEHFESAARYYEIYYNPETPYDDMSHDMGTSEIEMMNEKIRAHDNAVGRHNTLLAEYKYELEKII